MYAVVILLQGPGAALLHRGTIWEGVVISQLGAIALPTVLFVWWGRYDWRALFPCARPTFAHVLLVTIATIGVALFTHSGVEWTKAHFHTPPLLEDRVPELVAIRSIPEAIVKFCLIALLPAIVEEGFFRGLCQSTLMRRYGRMAGCLLASLLFAAAHNNLAYLHWYFLLGLYLGYLRVWSGGLSLPILAHAINNGVTLWIKGAAP